jgi:acyl dehydratase
MNLRVGTLIPAIAFGPIEKSHLAAYADASGDHNEIHLDEEAAKRAGLSGIIAHGMLSAALLADCAVGFVNASGSWKLSHFQTRFKGMVFLADTISSSGVVKSCADGVLKVDLQAKNQRGDIVTLGSAEFLQR